MRRLNFAIATVFMIILSTVDELAAQVPSNLPAGDPEPLPFTPVNIIIYIVLPVALLYCASGCTVCFLHLVAEAAEEKA